MEWADTFHEYGKRDLHSTGPSASERKTCSGKAWIEHLIRACPIWRFFGLAVISWAGLGCGIVGFVHIECQFESVVAHLVTVDLDFFRPRGEVATKSGPQIIR